METQLENTGHGGRSAGRLARSLALACLLALGMAGCASDTPYTAPSSGPNRTLPRQPVVAPSGPGSPWWWPAPADWWPIQPWG